MRETFRNWIVVVAATVFMGTGFAAGFVVRPALRRPPTPEAQAVAPALGADAPRVGRGVGSSPRGEETVRLAAAAATLSALPRFQPQPASPPPQAPPPRKTLALEELPAPVQKVVQQLMMGRKVQRPEYQLRERNGQRYIKAEWHVDNFEQEYAIDEQGVVHASEQDLSISDVPAPVTRGIQAAYPGALVMEAERNELRDAPPFYEIEIKHEGRQMEIHLGEDGSILRQKVR